MQDKHGKDIKLGDRVKNNHGLTAIVTGIVSTRAEAQHRLDVEVVPHAAPGNRAADGDTIVWGT